MQFCGFEPGEVTYINMLTACVKCGDVETARQMFDNMSCPSVISWNAIISGYSQNENHKEAIDLFREMQFQTVKPDRTTVTVILKQVHAALQKAALHTENYVASGLIGMYSKCGRTEMVGHIFSSLPELDIVCWNSMIAVLSCCTKLSSSFQGRQIHSQVVKDGYESDVFVGTALVDMYCKCGDIDEAQKHFDMMPVRNVVTWNEMIHGYAENGRGDDAARLYEDIIASGVKPDRITFISVDCM
ncbi:Haloacid dehalogenase-like hydrolase superfamily protein isoform 1 [Hibiscus syriacus]|uniref:Haloacid dehalogenase-like hydrolase superfamily protein isoform 1 n=1 Tax=Hibiscus syriacus TaxID=106335 RepID=A0A6A2XFG7_HIBSY|nr:Haloacid dehalogenase-like hydrolase superfamily protein isoform 1 [Hibiscus syriacus]